MERYNNYLKEWENEERSPGMDISEFSDYICEKLKNKEEAPFRELFQLIEKFIVDGNEVLRTAATTQFLENLINVSSNGDFPLESFANYLGEESKAYCKAWDEACGVNNEDIWK